MQIEVILTIAATLLCSGLLMLPVFLCAVKGCFGKIGQVLAVSWLIGALLLVATTFLDNRIGATFCSPNV
jgi:hypothetical protein